MATVKVGILTCSDRGARGQTADTAGAYLKSAVAAMGWQVAEYAVVADVPARITGRLRGWCDDKKLDVVLTCGGTGFGPRDVTPEATMELLDRQAPGLAAALIAEGLTHTPLAALSRGVSGQRKSTIIVNLPGSEKAVREGMSLLSRVLPHAVEMVRGRTATHPADGCAPAPPVSL